MTIFAKLTAATAACVLLGASVGSAHAGDVRSYPAGVTIGVVAGAELSRDQARAYRDFRKQREYFGAFYRNPQCEGAFWVRDFNDLASAKSAAHKGCMECADNKGQCELYAVMVPAEIDLSQSTASGLGKSASRAYQGPYQKHQVDGRYGAFAISSATFGHAWNWQNEAEARATALAYCEARVAQLLTNLNIAGRTWAKKNGHTDCRVVDVFAP